ncbi:hypothetical protein M5689_022532 [Euphorbia peplus]|nr:hypothetical protein M5689_022531 [Euphorbia peplus]WCJ41681.1 hypothetical protein M5689_022532 [Euphorbia peplus]
MYQSGVQSMMPPNYNRSSYPPYPYMVNDNSNMGSFGAPTMQNDSPNVSFVADSEAVPINDTQDEQSDAVALKWTETREVLLCQSWIIITLDEVVGNAQKGKDYWKRITKYYNKYRNGDGPEITEEQAKRQWFKMSREVSFFNAAYISVNSSYHSGHDEAQLIRMACDSYTTRSEKNLKFRWLHCWEVLKDNQRWLDFAKKNHCVKKTKRISNASGAETSSGSTHGASEGISAMEVPRPKGQKAAKKAAKAKKNISSGEDPTEAVARRAERQASFVEYNRLMEIREKRGAERIRIDDEQVRIKDFETIRADTSHMDAIALENHRMICDYIKAKYGLK